MNSKDRFSFIAHALNGDGPFRPAITYDSYGKPSSTGGCYIVRYPRESDDKYARRCELAYYASPLAKVTSRFSSYIASKPVQREIKNPLMDSVYRDTDGKGNNADVFWQDFMVEAKARGSMLLLVDMPRDMPDNMAGQMETRAAPYWTMIPPEKLTDYEVGDDGKFTHAAFTGSYVDSEGDSKPCVWYFDAQKWECQDTDGTLVDGDEHGLGVCPLLIFTESGDFPYFGPFAPIADLSKRLYNLDSELDEILRSQTFSLLTMQVPEDSASEQRLEAARTAGETIGTNNLMVHSGSTPSFIAPADGPAKIYLERIQDIRSQINEIGLEVATPNQRESGIAMQMRFQLINSELARFAIRMEGIEDRAWDLTAKWLGMSEYPQPQWPRDFNIADPEQELDILRNMQETAMPQEVIIQQQKRVVVTQFGGLDMEEQEKLTTVLENGNSAT